MQVPTDGSGREYPKNASHSLAKLYKIGFDVMNYEEYVEMIQCCVSLSAKDILRCVSAAAVVNYVFQDDNLSPWKPPDQIFEKLGTFEERTFRTVLSNMGKLIHGSNAASLNLC